MITEEWEYIAYQHPSTLKYWWILTSMTWKILWRSFQWPCSLRSFKYQIWISLMVGTCLSFCFPVTAEAFPWSSS